MKLDKVGFEGDGRKFISLDFGVDFDGFNVTQDDIFLFFTKKQVDRLIDYLYTMKCVNGLLDTIEGVDNDKNNL